MFSLKDAVYELIADTAELVPEYLAFSRMVDDLGLHTFETYAAAREQIIADQAAVHAGAVHAGGPAVGRHHRGAAGRHP